MTHIGPGNRKPGTFGYEFDLSLADCQVLMHGNGPRDPGAGKVEIIPPDGKCVGLNIVGAIMAAEDMLAAAKEVLALETATPSAIREALFNLRRAVAKAERRGQ